MINKLIIAGIFVLILINCFHADLKESFIGVNEGKDIYSLMKGEMTDLSKKRELGSTGYMNRILKTVSGHLETAHIHRTMELIKEKSHSRTEDGNIKIDFSPLNNEQVNELKHITHIKDLKNAVDDSIKYMGRYPRTSRTRNYLKFLGGN